MLISLVVYCLLGAIAGVLAGLLGVGGGIVSRAHARLRLRLAKLPAGRAHAHGPWDVDGQHHVHVGFQLAGPQPQQGRPVGRVRT